MKKLFFLILIGSMISALLAVPFASASFLDWITGKAAEGSTDASAAVAEKVKCVFLNSYSTTQTCYTDNGRFKCSGIGTCIAEVTGNNAETLRWKSSCGGEVYTTIDGSDESSEFKCAEVQQATPAPTQTTELVKEQVKCVFANSNDMQKCYTKNGRFGCAGVGSCIADVSGEKEAKLAWTTGCIKTFPAEVYTTIDGANEDIGFSCEQSTTPVAVETAPTPVPTPVYVREQVKCLFTNSNTEQKCWSESAACSGVGTCIADVSGEKGKMLTWKSSCGGYAYTAIDGNNEYAEFKCEPVTAIQIQQPEVAVSTATAETSTAQPKRAMIQEQVRCIFANSDVMQRCYTTDGRFGCSGQGECTVVISDYSDRALTWQSTCSNEYAYTQNNGVNEELKFACGPKEVKLYFFYWKENCAACESERAFLEQLKQKYPLAKYDSYDVANPPEGRSYGAVVMSYIKSGVPTVFLDDKIWTGYDENIAREIEEKVKQCSSSSCSLTPIMPQALAKSTNPAPQTAVQADIANEQIECIFWNSDVLANPHTARPEKCYTYDGRFGCTWEGNVVEKDVNSKRVRYPYCVLEVSGARGTKLTWKSTCGGYAYTVIDGNMESAEFTCTPSSEVKEEQLSGKGFKRAYWQCYDGAEQKTVASESVSCKTSEAWQTEAQNFCKGHCYADGSKCGVNSFGVSEECYPDFSKEEVVFTQPAAQLETRAAQPVQLQPVQATQAVSEQAKSEQVKKSEEKPEEKSEVLICKDSCPLNGKCYPFGYRKEGRFCSDDSTFVPQFEADKPCDNSFECISNVCVDGNCISSGLIQKIITWFKRLF